MSDRQATRRDSYLIVCDPMETSAGAFAARFFIYKGDTNDGELVACQEYPTEEFAEASEANLFALESADRWLKIHG
jgi:hypothetical protein